GKMSVGMFEERHELGSGWSSEEPSPGFMGNTCSNDHMGWYHTVAWWDFPEFKDYGGRFAYTPVVTGTAFDDETCALTFSAFADVDPSQERTAELIGRFSERDADTYLRLWDKAINHWYPATMEWMHNPAKPANELDALDRLVMNPEAGIDPQWLLMNPVQVFTTLFEDPHNQVGYFRQIQSWGIALDGAGMGWSALLSQFTWLPFHGYIVGGTHTLTHAAYRVIYSNGGEVFTSKKVDKVLIENGRAKGIRLADGTEVEAKVAVMTDVDPHQLVFDLVGPENLDPIIVRKVKYLSSDWEFVLWYSWAWTERPRWKCSDFDPAADDCMWMALGGSSSFDVHALKRESAERKAGIWPTEMNLAVSYMGQSVTGEPDQCLAPPEQGFKILTEQYCLSSKALSDGQWKARERQHAEEVVKITNRYAPNITWDTVAGYLPVTPYFTGGLARNYPDGNWTAGVDNVPSQIGRHRPIRELAGNRVPGVDGLYCTGTGWHPFAIANCSQGYNCYKVMSEDLGLEKTWESRPF
ncbi:MAG: hypothetical protein SV775_09730, partial [Thermodesulfobacteriota bacterium]|nr:hypothetical protein [Thermodesulfobacteriota bacterium]